MKLSGNKKKSKRLGKIIIAFVVIILAILAIFYIVLRLGLKPPEVNQEPKPTSSSATAAVTGVQTQPPVRDKTAYTFVILGMDDGNGNSDTIMVATFDDQNYTLDVVNIPRDTLVNVSWPTKKANSLYANGGMDRVIEGLTALLGFKVDFYVKVKLDAFSTLVDAIGGVNFDVPRAMNYEDSAQDLYIHLKAGLQLLDGPHALQLVRAREKVWATGDIGRIGMQQAFLKAAAEQILEKKASIKISALIDIFMNDVETNITTLNIGWLAQEFLKMDAVNVNFETIPANYYDEINGGSYCTIKVSEWLDVINTKLNPFDNEVTAGDISVLTRDAKGRLYVTDGVYEGKKSWGMSSTNTPSSDVSAAPSVSPSPSPSPAESSEPEPSASPTDILPSPSGEDGSPVISPIQQADDTSPSPGDSPSPTPGQN